MSELTDAQKQAIAKFAGNSKSLKEAIAIASMVGPLKGMDKRIYEAVVDFLAQKFQVAMLQRPELDEYFKELFDACTKTPFEKPPQTIEEFKNPGGDGPTGQG